MATVYVHAERAREFRDLFFKWKRERDPIVTEPPEGPPVGEEKQFVMVDDDSLTLHAREGLSLPGRIAALCKMTVNPRKLAVARMAHNLARQVTTPL